MIMGVANVEGVIKVDFDASTRSKAQALIHSILDPSFLVGIVCLDVIFTPLLTPTKLLQGRDIEVLRAYQLMESVIQVRLL